MSEEEWMISVECTHSQKDPRVFFAPIWANRRGVQEFMVNPYPYVRKWLEVHGYGDWDPDDSPDLVPHQINRALCSKCQICVFEAGSGGVRKVLGLPHPDTYSQNGFESKCFFSCGGN